MKAFILTAIAMAVIICSANAQKKSISIKTRRTNTNGQNNIKKVSIELTGYDDKTPTTSSVINSPNGINVNPVITATKSATVQGGGNPAPGSQLNYSVIVSNSTGTADATAVSFTDLLTNNLTLVAGTVKATPIGVNDSYNCIGNVGINVNTIVGGVLNNDISPDATSLSITAVSNAISAQGGKYSLDAAGTFTYMPAVGFSGSDIFTYTVKSSNTLSANEAATVSITVLAPIFFVDKSVGASGTGTLVSPFKDVSNVTGTGSNSIFIYSNAANYAGTLTLGANQKLIGQGATASLLSITGITVPPFSNVLPATGGTNPTIANAITTLTLNSGNDIEGVNIANTGGTAITGASVGALKVRDVTLSNSAGQALQIAAGGALDCIFKSISATGAAKGISVNNSTGSFQVTGTGTTAATGGTIQTMTTRGAEFISCTNVTLKNMNFTSSSTSNTACTSPAADNTNCNAAMHFKSVTGVTINNIAITGTTNNMGINLNNVSGFSLVNSTITGCGQTGGSSENGGIYALNLAGTCAITGSNINDSKGRGFFCYNGILGINPTVSLTVTSCQFKNSFNSATGASNFIFQGYGTSNNTLVIKSNDFSNPKTYGLDLLFGNTSVNSVQVGGTTLADGNTINAATSAPGSNAFELQGVGGTTVNYNVLFNTFKCSFSGSFPCNIGNQGASGSMTGRINNNTIVGAATGGSSNGISVAAYNTCNHITEIKNNTITGITNYGITVESNDNSTTVAGTARMDATIQNNNLTVVANTTYAHIGVAANGNFAGSSLRTCGNVSGNTINNVTTATGSLDIASFFGGSQVTLQGATAFIHSGGANADQTTALTNYWKANNFNVGTGFDEGYIGYFPSNGTITSGTCLIANNPVAASISSNDTVQIDNKPMLTEVESKEIIVPENKALIKTKNNIFNDNIYLIRKERPVTSFFPSQTVIQGAQAGETITVNGSGSGFLLPIGRSTTITFSTTVSNTPTTCAITNQASASGSNFTTINSNINTTNLIIPAPATVATFPVAVCTGESIVLNATCTGSTLNWYDQSSGGTLLGTGNSLPQSPVGNTTYYASCQVGGCPSVRVATNTVLVGAPSLNLTWIGNTSDWNTPSNWSGNFVPNKCTIVVVNAVTGGKVLPMVTGINNICQSLRINPGAAVNMAANAKLNVLSGN